MNRTGRQNQIVCISTGGETRTEYIPEELNKFCGVLHKVMDIGVVIELNILSDWIEQNKDVKDRLRKRLPIIEKDLQLSYASLKIKNLIGEK